MRLLLQTLNQPVVWVVDWDHVTGPLRAVEIQGIDGLPPESLPKRDVFLTTDLREP